MSYLAQKIIITCNSSLKVFYRREKRCREKWQTAMSEHVHTKWTIHNSYKHKCIKAKDNKHVLRCFLSFPLSLLSCLPSLLLTHGLSFTSLCTCRTLHLPSLFDQLEETKEATPSRNFDNLVPPQQLFSYNIQYDGIYDNFLQFFSFFYPGVHAEFMRLLIFLEFEKS